MTVDIETLIRATTPDEGNVELEGYYCINTNPYQCACSPERTWDYFHYEMKIIVWEEQDHPFILKMAAELKTLGFNPRIIEYKSIFGKAIDFEEIPDGATLG